MITGDHIPDPYEPQEKHGCLRLIVATIVALVLCAILGSCKSSGCGIDESYTAHDTTYIDRLQHDSIYIHDSVWHERIMKGDTVFDTRYIERTKYRDRVKHDSIYMSVVNTEVRTVEVEKELSRWQRLRLTLANIMLIALALVAIGGAWKLWKRIHR